MYKEARLPQNAKEGIVFMLIISIISVNTIAPMIMWLEQGFSFDTYKETLKILPFMWMIVVLLVNFVASPLVGKLMPKFVGPTDSFHSRVLFNILLNVTCLSLILSIVGPWVGMREITTVPIENFLHIWPRNFAIAFWIETLVAQPIARFVMKKMHSKQEKGIA